MAEQPSDKAIRTWVVMDHKTGKQVGGPYTSLTRIRARVDALDNDWGAYRYGIKRVYPEDEGG